MSLWCVRPETFRAAILTADRLGFTNGEYVFIYLDTIFTPENNDEKSSSYLQPWFDPREPNVRARRAFETVLYVRQRLFTGQPFERLAEQIVQFARKRSSALTFHHRRVQIGPDEMNFYDGVVSYFQALKFYSKAKGRNISSKMTSDEFKSMICNRTIEGTKKNITMNEICDRIDLGYAIFDLDPDSGLLQVCLSALR